MFFVIAALFVLGAVFAPAPLAIWGLPLRYEDLLTVGGALLAIGASIMAARTRWAVPSAAGDGALIVCALACATILPVIASGAGGEIAATGLQLETLRLAKYVAVVLVASRIKPRRTRAINRLVVAAGIAVVTIQLAQLLSNSFNEKFVQFYGNAQHLRASLASDTDDSLRYYGATLENPNITGLFLLIPFCISLGQLFTTRPTTPRDRVKLRLFRALGRAIPVYLFLGIVLTRSRASLSSLVVATVVFLLSETNADTERSLSPGRMFVGLVLLLGAIAVPLTLRFGYAGLEPKDFAEGIMQGSLALKVHLVGIALTDMTVWNYLIGLGPHVGPNVDFEYGYIFTWYGMTGVALYGLAWCLVIGLIRSLRERHSERRVLMAIVAGLLTMNVSQTTFLVSRIFPVFLIVLVLYVRGGSMLSAYRSGKGEMPGIIGEERERSGLVASVRPQAL